MAYEPGAHAVQAAWRHDEAASREARALMRYEPRYRWLGELDHAGAMRWLARSHAMVISSLMEGGAHVVIEAMRSAASAVGIQILATATVKRNTAKVDAEAAALVGVAVFRRKSMPGIVERHHDGVLVEESHVGRQNIQDLSLDGRRLQLLSFGLLFSSLILNDLLLLSFLCF